MEKVLLLPRLLRIIRDSDKSFLRLKSVKLKRCEILVVQLCVPVWLNLKLQYWNFQVINEKRQTKEIQLSL
jgi:hypothetical protein